MTTLCFFRRSRAALACALAVFAACTDDPAGPEAAPVGAITVQAAVVPNVVTGISVEVTAPDIPTPIIANIPVANGAASGVVNVPVGGDRRFTLRAFDQSGLQTHVGEATVAVRPGTNPTLTVGLRPLAGQQPITVTFGFFTIAVTNPTPVLQPGQSQQLTAVVTGLDGKAIENPTIQWGSLNPAVAAVDGAGRITARVVGETQIGATYEGIAATTDVAVAQGYTMTDLGIPGGGAFNGSVAYDINDGGEVVGEAVTPNGNGIAFRWTQAAGMTLLGTVSASTTPQRWSYPTAINNAGVVVGVGWTQGQVKQAVRWTGTTEELLFSPSATVETYATDITNAGIVLGYHVTDGHVRMTIIEPERVTSFGTELVPKAMNERRDIVGTESSSSGQHAVLRLASTQRVETIPTDGSSAAAVNESGVIAGTAANAGSAGVHAVIWTRNANGTFTTRDLGSIGGSTSVARDINDAGQVVGYSGASAGALGSRAFVWSEATGMIELGRLPGSTGDSHAWAINARGQIVGSSVDAAGRTHAVLWTPATPPAP